MKTNIFIAIMTLSTLVCAQTLAQNVSKITLSNGQTMPQLGFGTWTVIESASRCVKDAVELGYRLFDSAQGYENEENVYQGIKKSGINRSEVFITTKISPDNMRNGTVRESLDKSIEAFGGDYLDLVLIHWPVQEKIQETWQIMEEYVEKGKIKSIGLSNFNPHHYEALMKYAKIKPVLNQIEIHPYFSNQENVEYFKKQGLAVQCWSPLASGKVIEDETLLKLAEKYDKSVAQIVLRWDIQRGLLTIPRSENKEHIAENIEVFNFELSDEDMKIINSLNRNERTSVKNNPDSFPW
ncbi:aldo/keto reductase [Bacteroidales bacterium OttesenSCG-928-I14]|nr:aldo/keto reductase [Bacteroidales bacterium OttesenSCG-928-I14]